MKEVDYSSIPIFDPPLFEVSHELPDTIVRGAEDSPNSVEYTKSGEGSSSERSELLVFGFGSPADLEQELATSNPTQTRIKSRRGPYPGDLNYPGSSTSSLGSWPSLSETIERSSKHPPTFACNICSKRFNSPHNLRSHVSTHTVEPPFFCQACGIGLARRHYGKRHECLHHYTKNTFICRGKLRHCLSWGCGRRFEDADALGRHFRTEAGRICIRPVLDWEKSKRQEESSHSTQQCYNGPHANLEPIHGTPLRPDPITAPGSSAGPGAALFGQDSGLQTLDRASLETNSRENDGGQFPYPPDQTFSGLEIVNHPMQPSLVTSPESHISKIEKDKRRYEKAAKQGSPSDSIQDLDQTLSLPPPSGSAYQSDVGTNTESVCSIGSIGTTFGLSMDFLQDFIAFFGDQLIDRTGACAWAQCALSQYSSDDAERRLMAPLKHYAITVLASTYRPKPFDEIQRRITSGVTDLLRRHRPKFARYFLENAIAAPSISTSMRTRPKQFEKQLLLSDKLGLFQHNKKDAKNSALTPVEAETEHKAEEEYDDGNETDSGDHLANITPIREFFVSDEAFQNLAVAIRRSLYYDERAEMEHIAQQILRGLFRNPKIDSQSSSESQTRDSLVDSLDRNCVAQFHVNWGIEEFLRSQFGRVLPRIGSLVALTGSAFYAQATTCEEYMRTTWPNTGAFLISALQSFFESRQGLDPDERKFLPCKSRLTSPTTPGGFANGRSAIGSLSDYQPSIMSITSSPCREFPNNYVLVLQVQRSRLTIMKIFLPP